MVVSFLQYAYISMSRKPTPVFTAEAVILTENQPSTDGFRTMRSKISNTDVRLSEFISRLEICERERDELRQKITDLEKRLTDLIES